MYDSRCQVTEKLEHNVAVLKKNLAVFAFRTRELHAHTVWSSLSKHWTWNDNYVLILHLDKSVKVVTRNSPAAVHCAFHAATGTVSFSPPHAHTTRMLVSVSLFRCQRFPNNGNYTGRYFSQDSPPALKHKWRCEPHSLSISFHSPASSLSPPPLLLS